MFTNYHYFIALAEECNISRAAQSLFITHQCLSKFLSNLEAEYGVPLFERKPVFSLTYAGTLMLEALRQTKALDINLHNEYADILHNQVGEISLGTTEGRFRILMPDIMSEFKQSFPSVQLRIVSAPSPDLREMILNNKLDIMIANESSSVSNSLEVTELLSEKLYLVISDAMLEEYFPNQVNQMKEQRKNGIDLRLFRHAPFALNMPNFNSHILLDQHLKKIDASLNCIHMSSHPDLHHMMSARDYAASFCLTMYLPSLLKLNSEIGNKLNLFPIKDFSAINSVVLTHEKSRVFPHYSKSIIQLIKRQCKRFSEYDII